MRRIVIAALVAAAVAGGAGFAGGWAIGRKGASRAAEGGTGGGALDLRTLIPERGGDRFPLAQAGRSHYLSHGCSKCHLVADFPITEIDPSRRGPDLKDVGARLSPAEIVEAIVAPNARVAEPRSLYGNERGARRMPEANKAMTVRELVELVVFLDSQR